MQPFHPYSIIPSLIVQSNLVRRIVELYLLRTKLLELLLCPPEQLCFSRTEGYIYIHSSEWGGGQAERNTKISVLTKPLISSPTRLANVYTLAWPRNNNTHDEPCSYAPFPMQVSFHLFLTTSSAIYMAYGEERWNPSTSGRTPFHCNRCKCTPTFQQQRW